MYIWNWTFHFAWSSPLRLICYTRNEMLNFRHYQKIMLLYKHWLLFQITNTDSIVSDIFRYCHWVFTKFSSQNYQYCFRSQIHQILIVSDHKYRSQIQHWSQHCFRYKYYHRQHYFHHHQLHNNLLIYLILIIIIIIIIPHIIVFIYSCMSFLNPNYSS